MSSRRAMCRAFVLGAAIAASAGMARNASPLPALGMLEPGLWQLRGEDDSRQTLCVADPYSLIQLRHGATPCSRLVIANEKNAVTIHYSCPGAGWGRTTLRVETPRLARIDSQGIAKNEPFAFIVEARRIGSCGERLGVDR
jgi:hypothetical protein